MPSLEPPALSQLSGQFCQGRILLTRAWPSVTIGRCDPGPLSSCVRFQAISRGGIVNGPVSQLWRTSSSQYLLFGAVKWSNINHELFIEIDWKCSQITDHPGERGRGTLLTLKVTRSASVCVSWSLCIIGHCHQDSLFPITMLFLMLSLDSLPRVSWLPACAARCSPGWRWPPLRHLGSSQDSKPNSSYENFTEITSTCWDGIR